MSKHKAAIRTIRETIKQLSAEKARCRAEILKLAFDETGKRRPETGPDRNTMRIHYHWQVARHIRANLIAYGLLRGKPYKAIECTVREPLYLIKHLVMLKIHESFGEDSTLKAEWPMARVDSLILKGVDIEVPVLLSTPAIQKPKGRIASFFERILA